MQDFFGNLLGAILVTAWIVWGIRVVHRVWNSDNDDDKDILLIFFFKGILLYLIFYWIPLQIYLLLKKNQTRGQGTTHSPNHAKDTKLLMKIDLIGLETPQLHRIRQALTHMPPDTANRDLLLSRVKEILHKRNAAGYTL